MSKHTPGPWEITEHRMGTVDGDPWYSINKGEIDIAYDRWSHNDESTRRANARLIAAVPDLLEAARLAILAFDAVTLKQEKERRAKAEVALRAALAKTEEEE